MAARKAFKVRKSDHGKLFLVGKRGGRAPAKSGKPGFLMFVTKNGHKRLVRREGKYVPARTLRATDFTDALAQNKKETLKTFRRSRELRRTVTNERGISFGPTSGTVRRIVDDLLSRIRNRRTARYFLLNLTAVVEDSSGERFTVSVSVPIAKRAFAKIDRKAIQHFVTMKVYALLARELEVRGLVTQGSSNHVQKLPENEGQEDRNKWTKGNLPWGGRKKSVVKIVSLRWEIEHVRFQ